MNAPAKKICVALALTGLVPALTAAAEEKRDSLPTELKAVVALIESSNKLNATAMELIRTHVAHPPVSPEVPAPAPPGPVRNVGTPPATPESAPVPTSVYVQAPPTVVRDTVFMCDTVVVYAAPETPGGSYVWIPDSLGRQVDDLLAGHGIDEIRMHEDMVTRGVPLPDPDKDPEVLRDRNLGRFHRGLFNYRFLPKGQWVFGLTANYGEFSTDDIEMFSVLEDVTLGGHTFSIKPQMQYLLRDNMAVGLRFNYTQTKGTIDNFGLDIDEDMSFSLHDITYRSESYAAALTYTQYLGLSRRGRFGIFNEVELSFSSGNGDFVRPFDGKLKTTHTTTTGVGLNFSPGVSVFMMKQASFNISFGVFGFYLKNEKQWVDGVESGNRLRSGANFRFNIFNINFGIAIHI